MVLGSTTAIRDASSSAQLERRPGYLVSRDLGVLREIRGAFEALTTEVTTMWEIGQLRLKNGGDHSVVFLL
jgi:hypothetical protein